MRVLSLALIVTLFCTVTFGMLECKHDDIINLADNIRLTAPVRVVKRVGNHLSLKAESKHMVKYYELDLDGKTKISDGIELDKVFYYVYYCKEHSVIKVIGKIKNANL